MFTLLIPGFSPHWYLLTLPRRSTGPPTPLFRSLRRSTPPLIPVYLDSERGIETVRCIPGTLRYPTPGSSLLILPHLTTHGDGS